VDDVLYIAQRLPHGHSRVVCPLCSHERRAIHKRERTMSIAVHDGYALYNCHHCQQHGRVSLDQDERNVIKFKKRERVSMAAAKAILPAHVEWLNGRGINDEAISWAKLHSQDLYIRDVGETSCIAFPYGHATKFRAPHVKAFSCSGSPSTFFMQDQAVFEAPLTICEGEIDCLTLHSSGIPNAVSVPNGAPAKFTNGKVSPKEDHGFRYVWSANKIFDRCKKIIIATDNDEPGDALAEELARRIGKYRCWRVKWPTDIKDANEALVKLGAEAVRDLVNSAEPWPVAGLYETNHYVTKVLDLYTRGEGKGESVGLAAVDSLYTIVPGQLTVVTGVPSAGKSEFVDHVMVSMAEALDWRFAICSFENPPSTHIVKLLEKYRRSPFYQGKAERMKEGDVRLGMSWVSDHFYWIEQADGAASNIDDIIDRAKVAVMRYGCRGIVIDPYNYIDKPRDMAETEYVSELLTKLKQFAVGHDVHVWFVAHPTKLKKDESGRIPPPGGYEISGSAAWFSKADCGLTVHRGTNDCETEIHLWKVRFKWVGKQGMVMLAYDPSTGRYTDGRSSRLQETSTVVDRTDEAWWQKEA
jgi:twinkle protein